MPATTHIVSPEEQVILDSLYRFRMGEYPMEGELHDERGEVIRGGFVRKVPIYPVPKMLLCASLWPKTPADKETSVGLQGMESALDLLIEHGLVRKVPHPRMFYGAWQRSDGLVFESQPAARPGEAKYYIRRPEGESALEAAPFTFEGTSWSVGIELTSDGIDLVRSGKAPAPKPGGKAKKRPVPKRVETAGKAKLLEADIQRLVEDDSGESLSKLLERRHVQYCSWQRIEAYKDARLAWEGLADKRRYNRASRKGD